MENPPCLMIFGSTPPFIVRGFPTFLGRWIRCWFLRPPGPTTKATWMACSWMPWWHISTINAEVRRCKSPPDRCLCKWAISCYILQMVILNEDNDWPSGVIVIVILWRGLYSDDLLLLSFASWKQFMDDSLWVVVSQAGATSTLHLSTASQLSGVFFSRM